jgi:polar amino acid transport system substrate-binding protein
MGRSVNLSRRAGIALLVPAALLAACGGSGSTTTPTPSTAAAGPTAQASIAAEVPAAIKAAAPLQIATDATYAPNEFVDPNTGAVVGWDVQLAKDVCAVLGVACTINNVTFSDIIPALLESPAKYQMSFSSFTPTAAREAKGIDFITYYQAGEAWIVKASGGASISSAADMCGHAVAVETGTTEESDAWGYMGMQPGGAKIPGDTNHCTAAGKQDITVLSFGTQTQANSALLSGRADFGWLDQPVADYQVKTLGGKVKIGGTACSVSPYGVAMVKTTGLEQAVADAIKYLIDNHYYTNLLNTWGVADGAITSSAVTVNNNSSIGASCVPSY